MDKESLLKKVRSIEIKARGLSNHIFAGAYQTLFKGKGMTFSEVREYIPGDDIRDIEWNVTARFSNPYVKVYEEDRAINLMLLIDISNSIQNAMHQNPKREIIAELAAVLAFSALKNNDNVGAIFFAGNIEYYIPPKKGKQHILSIIRSILTVEPKDHNTSNFKEAIHFMNKTSKRKNIVFLISDLWGEIPDKELRMAAIKHDFIALQILDKTDNELLDLGLIRAKDSESGRMLWLSTNQRKNRKRYTHVFEERQKELKSKFLKYKADLVCFPSNEDYYKNLKLFFKRR